MVCRVLIEMSASQDRIGEILKVHYCDLLETSDFENELRKNVHEYFDELGIKKQLIQITNVGENVLQEEFSKYQQIFEHTDRVFFRGRIVSGIGEGRYYTEQKGYVSQFKEKLGFTPYPGTLNVEIELVEKNKLRLLKNHTGMHLLSALT